jgi:hypothetical protein
MMIEATYIIMSWATVGSLFFLFLSNLLLLLFLDMSVLYYAFAVILCIRLFWLAPCLAAGGCCSTAFYGCNE